MVGKNPILKQDPVHQEVPARYKLMAIVFRLFPKLWDSQAHWWLSRQIRGKGYFTIYRMKDGSRFELHLDDWISWCIFSTGLYYKEVKVSTHLLNSLNQGMVFFDIGTNFGYYTIQGARRVGGKGFVHSFEPVKEICSWLKRNITFNHLDSAVFVNQVAVSDYAGEIPIHLSNYANMAMSSIVYKPTTTKVVILL